METKEIKKEIDGIVDMYLNSEITNKQCISKLREIEKKAKKMKNKELGKQILKVILEVIINIITLCIPALTGSKIFKK